MCFFLTNFLINNQQCRANADDDKDDTPMFLGDDGTLYNKSYHVIKNHAWVREIVEDESSSFPTKSYQVILFTFYLVTILFLCYSYFYFTFYCEVLVTQ